jgi:hypothetical protein
MANSIGTWKRLKGASAPSDSVVINTQYFTTPGSFTYTPTAGMIQCIVECVGGGGGGGALGGETGGGGGAYCKKLFDAATIGASQPLVVGSGGIGYIYSTSTPSTDGTITTFGTGPILSAGPGIAGAGGFPSGGLGGTATGGDINIDGQISPVIFNGTSPTTSGMGGNSGLYGNGGTLAVSALSLNGNATGYGAGGGATNDAADAGNGTGGIIIITEYIS